MAHRFQVSSLDVLGQREQPPLFVPARKFRVNPFDLLGQDEIYPYPVYLPGRVQPKLTIAWNSFHQNFFSGIPVLFQRGRLPKGAPPPRVFRDCIIERPMPRRAILASFLLYVAAILMPWPDLPAAPLRNPAFDNTQLTWSGRIEDLPLLDIPKQKSAAKAKAPAPEPVTAENTDAYHPRQRIYTDPVHPTHARQTLVNPAAPPEAPQCLPPMPNVLQVAPAAPCRPRTEISEQTPGKRRPREVNAALSPYVPAPDESNFEQRTASIH